MKFNIGDLVKVISTREHTLSIYKSFCIDKIGFIVNPLEPNQWYNVQFFDIQNPVPFKEFNLIKQ
jgi:hypothetical protein